MKAELDDTNGVSSPGSAAKDEVSLTALSSKGEDEHTTDSSSNESTHHRDRSRLPEYDDSPQSPSSQNNDDSDTDTLSDQTLPSLPGSSSRSLLYKASSEGSSETMRALSSEPGSELHPYSPDISSDTAEPDDSGVPMPSNRDQLGNSSRLAQADIGGSDGDPETEY